MRSNKTAISILTLAALFFAVSCKKKSEDPEAPTIGFVSVSATEVVQYDNELKIVINYEDFQGDLGNSNPDVYGLSVKDARLAVADWYHVPPMTPDDKELHIKGNYTITLRPMFLMGNGANETTKLTIQMTDKAGNKSNVIETPQITITQ